MAAYYFSWSTGNDSTGLGTAASPWFNFANKKAGASALSPGDICYFKAGDTFRDYVNVDSNGTAANPIVLDRYGTGNDPVFTIASPATGWTQDGATNVWYKGGMFADTYCVNVDASSGLGYWTGSSASQPAGTFRLSGSTLYIRLWDSSNPNSHTIYAPTAYQFNSFRGIVRGSGSRGSYLHIKHLKVICTNGIGISLGQPYSEIQDCTAVGCGREGFFLNGYYPEGEMAHHCKVVRSTATYCNSRGDFFGQAITVNSYNSWVISCIVTNNFKEGVDFLDYDIPPIKTEVHHGGAIFNIIKDNMLDPLSAKEGAGLYFDGAHDMLAYGNIVKAGTGFSNNKNLDCISILSEFQNRPNYNMYIVNNLAYDARGECLDFRNGGDAPNYNNAAATYGNVVVNNTFIRGNNNGYGCAFRFQGLGTSVRTTFRNNIVYNNNGYIMSNYTTTSPAYIDMDYNCYYDPGRSVLFSGSESTPGYTLAQWQAINVGGLRFDQNSINANPQLVDITPATIDAHLTVASSPCINAGMNNPWTPPQWVIDAGVLADNGAVVGSTRPDGVSDSGTMDMGYHYYNPTPTGSLLSTNVQPATLYLGTVNTVSILFITASTWPANGQVVVTFPTTLSGGFTINSGGTSTATFTTNGSGALTTSSSGATLTMVRSGGSVVLAGTLIGISVTNILNPPQAGATGPYIVKTTDAAGTTIDIDSNVSADQIVEPPAGFKTMTISGVSMANVTIMS